MKVTGTVGRGMPEIFSRPRYCGATEEALARAVWHVLAGKGKFMVVSATPDHAKEFERRLKEKFEHLGVSTLGKGEFAK